MIRPRRRCPRIWTSAAIWLKIRAQKKPPEGGLFVLPFLTGIYSLSASSSCLNSDSTPSDFGASDFLLSAGFSDFFASVFLAGAGVGSRSGCTSGFGAGLGRGVAVGVRSALRSEERRVGKEGRSRWSACE